MLYYDRIDISEGFDLVKSNKSREDMICHYWCFNHGFQFQYFVCNGCHNLSMMCLNISNIAIITVKNLDYSFIMYNISKSEAINLLQNHMLEDFFFYFFFCLVYIQCLGVYASIGI